jgi:hypothetical protein
MENKAQNQRLIFPAEPQNSLAGSSPAFFMKKYNR